MVSSLTRRNAVATIEALALGAVDFVEKPGGTVTLDIDTIRDELVAKVSAACRARPRVARAAGRATGERLDAETLSRRAVAEFPARGAVLIGVSTGGPRTLDDILPPLPESFPWPIVVAQHMPANFTGAFAAGLDKRCALTVTEVTAPTPLRAGHVYIGRGGADVVIESRLGRAVANAAPAKPDYPWHPSVNRLVASAMEAMDPRTLVGVQLTGMGDDGADAMASLMRAGGRTIAEDSSTAIVFGMPQELIRRGGAGKVLPCDRIAAQLSAWIR